MDEDVRFDAHKRLLALDAATVELMKLVSLNSVGGSDWHKAVNVQNDAIRAMQETFDRVSLDENAATSPAFVPPPISPS